VAEYEASRCTVTYSMLKFVALLTTLWFGYLTVSAEQKLTCFLK